MEATGRNRPTTRTSKIPSRVRTASVPRPFKTVDFSPCTEEKEQQKRVRRKWKSFNCAPAPVAPGASSPVHAINNNTVDLLSQWREELADEQNIHSLLQLAKDLMAFEKANYGPEEVSYRQEQALYWLCKAAERGSKEARDTITEMLNGGQGVNETNFEAVYACSWRGRLTVSQLMGRRLGRKAFRHLELGRGFCTSDQLFRCMKGKDINNLDAQDVQDKIHFSQRITSEQLAEAGAQQMDGKLPELDCLLNNYRGRWNPLVTAVLWLVLLCFASVAMTFYDVFSPLLLVFGLVYKLDVSHKDFEKFEAWRKVWPHNLLIPGLFESALRKFQHRKRLHNSLGIMVMTVLMASFNVGSYINYTLSILAIIITAQDNTRLTYTSYLLFYAIRILDLSHYYQVLPCILLTYEALSKTKPATLWPPLICPPLSTGLETAIWTGCHAIACLHLAIASRINRFKTTLVCLGILIFMTSQCPMIVLAQHRQNAQSLIWQDYSDLCIDRDAWTQRVEQQLQCAKFVGLPFVEWTGQVSGLHLKPSFIFHESIHAFLNTMMPVQFRSFLLDNLGSLQCNVRISMRAGKRNIMGSPLYKTILAQVKNANLCLNVDIGQEVEFSGLIQDYGHDSPSHLFIQKLSKKK